MRIKSKTFKFHLKQKFSNWYLKHGNGWNENKRGNFSNVSVCPHYFISLWQIKSQKKQKSHKLNHNGLLSPFFWKAYQINRALLLETRHQIVMNHKQNTDGEARTVTFTVVFYQQTSKCWKIHLNEWRIQQTDQLNLLDFLCLVVD